MSSTYNEIKRILFSERELDINKINEYLDIDFKATINIIFDIFYDSILISSYDEINLILYNIEEIIDNQSTDNYKIINNKVREVNYKLSKLNINTIEFRNIKLTLIDLNRKMNLKKEKTDNFNIYNLYSHLIFKEKDLKTVELIIKYKDDILKVTDNDGRTIFYNILEYYLKEENKEERDYFYDVIMLFIHNLEEELSKNKVIYLDKLSKYQDKNYVKEIMDRLKDINKVDTIELEKKYNISSIVKDAIIKEMESFHFDRSGRLELDVNFVTIDDQEAVCLDDAISLVKNADGSYYYYVAITDIPSLIPYQSQTFYDALGRVETIYLIDKNINLYHPNIANNLCSLLPNTKKNVLLYRYFVDSNLNIDTNSLEIIRGIITVKNRLTYDMVDTCTNIDLKTIGMLERISLITSSLKAHNSGKEIYRKVENYIKKAPDYHPSTFADKSVSANIVQESMLLVNSTTPKYFHDRNLIYIYRNHRIYNKEYADRLFKTITKTYEGNIPPKEYEKLVKVLAVSYLNAYYSSTSIGHEGLGYDYYSHSSSAARRFVDSYNQYLTYQQLFQSHPLTDGEYYELEGVTKEIIEYINDKKRENQKFQNEYNYLYSKGKILERRK